MKVDKETLQKVAYLARLHVKKEEEQKLLEDMSKILTWVEALKEVDTEGVAPLTHVTQEVNVMRADEARLTIGKADALKNAPKHNNHYFQVPKVLK